MFDRLFKSKFYSKCKSVIKVAKTRIDTIERRRNAMQKFLRNDIVDLLKNGLHLNAYGRAEGLLIEMNLTTCYHFLEQSFNCISTHLSSMNLQKECPEECREAVASVIFAAARFADVPELRELRSIFTERYQHSLESYINKEFVEKLKLKPPTKDMKLQLMQEIAHENGIEWDSKALEQTLYKPPPSEQDSCKNNDDDNYNVNTIDEKNRQDVLLVKTPSSNKKHLDSKSILPPYIIEPQVNSTDETSSEASSITITSPKSCGSSGEKDNHNCELVEEAKPKPKSVRRRRSKSTSDDMDYTKEKRNASLDEQDEKLGLKMSASKDKSDEEEEKELDRLLVYYSRKKSLPWQKYDVDDSEEPTSPTEATEVQVQDMLLKTMGHVHPNLPDYDDFVARFAALKEMK